ncbi:VOC family protein [soil metagenome]
MLDPNFIILYVTHPETSAAFYAGLLGHEPLEVSPGFAMLSLSSGVMLGLWARHTVLPEALISGGGSELAFVMPDRSSVDAMFADWSARGLPMAQTPTALDFGYTFVALDPDQHRLRVFAAGSPAA